MRSSSACVRDDDVRVAPRLQRADQRRAGEAACGRRRRCGVGVHRAPVRRWNTMRGRRGNARTRHASQRTPAPPCRYPIKHTLALDSAGLRLVGAVAAALLAYGMSQGRLLARSAGAGARECQRDHRPGRRRRRPRAARARALPRGLCAEDRADRARDAATRAPPARLTWRADYLVAHGVPRSALRFEI